MQVDDIAPQNTAADERYNPYQQQSYQEQFLQQKRQQQYEYEKYEYENQQKRLEQYEDDSSFARTYGLPSPPTHNKYQHTGPYRSSVRFQDYPDDYDNYLDTMKSNKNARKYGKKNIDDELEGGDYRDYSEHSRAGSDENDEEEEESDSDVSVSSDDSDVQIVSITKHALSLCSCNVVYHFSFCLTRQRGYLLPDILSSVLLCCFFYSYVFLFFCLTTSASRAIATVLVVLD